MHSSLCDQDDISAELVFLRGIFRQNGYSDRQNHRVLNPLVKVALLSEKPESVMLLPYVETFFTCINRVLSQHNIKSVGLLLRKLSGFLQSVKDNLQLKKPVVYSIPCECGQVYIGQTGNLIDTTRLNKNHQHIQLEHLENSAIAEHSINLGTAPSYITPAPS